MVLKQIRAAVEVYHHLPRYHEIFHVFFKYGFGDMLNMSHLQKILEIKDSHLPAEQKELHGKSPGVRFRMALEELGPTFVKLGQILSTRGDLVSEEYMDELHRLQDQVKPFPGSEARTMVETELCCKIDEVFKEFDLKPSASASMAQVHHGILKNNRSVAVKVQRPDIAETIAIDLAIMMDVAKFLDKHVEAIAVLNPIGVVGEFSKTLWQEQDFSNEARNMERFAKQFIGSRVVHVPAIYPDLCTERVLTMEFVTGQRIDEPDKLREHDLSPVKLSHNISRLIFQQMFKFGFFHADPHPGNMCVLPDGVVCLYDYGMMGTLSPVFRENIAEMVLGLSEKDHRLVTRSLLSMSEQGYADDPKKLEGDVEAFAGQYLDVPLKDLKLGFVLNRLLDVLREHKLRMLADFYLGIKALSQVESLGALLNPDLNFVQFGRPYATEVIEGKYEPTRVWKDLQHTFAEYWDVLRDLPLDLHDFYQKIKTGRYSFPVAHRIDPEGFEPLRNTLNHIANRMSQTFVLSAFLICSSIFFLADQQVLGAIGLVITVIMGLRLLFSIWKRGGF